MLVVLAFLLCAVGMVAVGVAGLYGAFRWPLPWDTSYDVRRAEAMILQVASPLVVDVEADVDFLDGDALFIDLVAGATDGTTAFLASGARRPGDYNTSLGTTLIFKGISREICRHPNGLIYCHKLPGGRWLPGAASN